MDLSAQTKQGRIHGNPVADGWAEAVMRKSLTILQIFQMDGPTNTSRCRDMCPRLETSDLVTKAQENVCLVVFMAICICALILDENIALPSIFRKTINRNVCQKKRQKKVGIGKKLNYIIQLLETKGRNKVLHFWFGAIFESLAVIGLGV